MAIRSELFRYWQEQEVRLGRRVTVSEVARSADLSRDAIQRLLDNNSTRFDGPTISAICKFFNVPAGMIPFLEYEPDDPERGNHAG